jgi:hypothetical protein
VTGRGQHRSGRIGVQMPRADLAFEQLGRFVDAEGPTVRAVRPLGGVDVGCGQDSSARWDG